jgi:hypothetical protein
MDEWGIRANRSRLMPQARTNPKAYIPGELLDPGELFSI